MKKVLVLNGPNLNLLGQREPAQYGYDTLATVETLCKEAGERLGVEVECRQSNHEGVLIDWIHEAGREIAAGKTIGGVMEPGGFSPHTTSPPDPLSGASRPPHYTHNPPA